MNGYPIKKAFHLMGLQKMLFMATCSIIGVLIFFMGMLTFSVIILKKAADGGKPRQKMVAYLNLQVPPSEHESLRKQISMMPGVKKVHLISKGFQLQQLKGPSTGELALLASNRQIPLPDGFEISFSTELVNDDTWVKLVHDLLSLPQIGSVVPAKSVWHSHAFLLPHAHKSLYLAGSLCFICLVYVSSLTLQLVLNRLRQEIAVMRLVGATDSFVNLPVYFYSFFQAGIGSGIGSFTFFFVFQLALNSEWKHWQVLPENPQFISVLTMAILFLAAIGAGLLGAYRAITITSESR
jgi:cell division transport system permease protein